MKKDGSKTFHSILTSSAYDYITSMQFGYLNVFNLFCAMDAFYKLWVINLVSGAFTLRDSVIRLVYLEKSSQDFF